jgi:hypothetical protein
MSTPKSGARVQFGPPDRNKGAETRPPRGRVCDWMGCATVLSTYNQSDRCWVHAKPDYSHPLKG